MNEKKPILSISILVSNRIDTVRKTMESVKRIMERIPCELIVVDTVGEKNSDGSLAIAREYATKLVHFDWIRDFAAARNAGLKLATGEWFMFMDDDEEFIDIEDLVDFFKSGKQKKYNSATYKLHDYSYDGNYTVIDMRRMVRRIPQTVFVGKIHEFLEPVFLPIKELKSYADHHGYAFATYEERLKKFERNYPILCEEFEQDKDNLRIRLQMIQEITSLKGYEAQTDELIEDTLFEEHGYKEKDLNSSFFQWVIVTYVRHAKRWYGAEKIMERTDIVRERRHMSELARLAVACMDIIASVEHKKADRIIKDILEIANNYEYLKTNHQDFYLQNILDLGLYTEIEYVLDRVTDGLVVCRDLGCDDTEFEKWIRWLERLVKGDDLEFEFRFKTGRKIAIHDNMRGLAFVRNTIVSFPDKKDSDLFKQHINDLFQLHESAGSSVEEASKDYEELKTRFGFSDDLKCMTDSRMTRICMIKNQPFAALPYVDGYFEAYDAISKDTQKTEEVKAGDLSQGISEATHNEMLYFGCFVYMNCNDPVKAWICLGNMPWASAGFAEWEGALRLAFTLNERLPQTEIMFGIIKIVMANASMKAGFVQLLKNEPGIKRAVDDVIRKMSEKA